MANSFSMALKKLKSAGVSLVDVAFPQLNELPSINAKGGISAVEAYSWHREQIARSGALYDQRVRGRILAGAEVTGVELYAIQQRRAELIASARSVYIGLDALIMPTTPIVPPPIAGLDQDEDFRRINLLSLRNTFSANFLDGCAISLPITSPGEPPVGLMLMAPHGQDLALLAVAQAVESRLQS